MMVQECFNDVARPHLSCRKPRHEPEICCTVLGQKTFGLSHKGGNKIMYILPARYLNKLSNKAFELSKNRSLKREWIGVVKPDSDSWSILSYESDVNQKLNQFPKQHLWLPLLIASIAIVLTLTSRPFIPYLLYCTSWPVKGGAVLNVS
jgi:hypothetical protein